jgi:hypothetical protein
MIFEIASILCGTFEDPRRLLQWFHDPGGTVGMDEVRMYGICFMLIYAFKGVTYPCKAFTTRKAEKINRKVNLCSKILLV